jgi:hypothetical protein
MSEFNNDAGFARVVRAMAMLTMIMIISAPLGCERKTTDSNNSDKADAKLNSDSQTVALPANLFLTSSPEDPKPVSEIRAAAVKGDAICVIGNIAGREKPFVNGVAMFQLADLSLPLCNAKPDDHCPTPWDLCCEPADRISAHSVTAQVNGPDGRPLAIELNGRNGLSPGKKVVVRGSVIDKPEGGNVIIAVEGLYIVEG